MEAVSELLYSGLSKGLRKSNSFLQWGLRKSLT